MVGGLRRAEARRQGRSPGPTTGFLKAIETLKGAVESALMALLKLEALIDEPIGHFVETKEGFAAVGAGEFPVVDGHAFDLDEFNGGLGLEFGFEILEKGVELGLVFIGKDKGFGAQPVAERVKTDRLPIFRPATLNGI